MKYEHKEDKTIYVYNKQIVIGTNKMLDILENEDLLRTCITYKGQWSYVDPYERFYVYDTLKELMEEHELSKEQIAELRESKAICQVAETYWTYYSPYDYDTVYSGEDEAIREASDYDALKADDFVEEYANDEEYKKYEQLTSNRQRLALIKKILARIKESNSDAER